METARPSTSKRRSSPSPVTLSPRPILRTTPPHPPSQSLPDNTPPTKSSVRFLDAPDNSGRSRLVSSRVSVPGSRLNNTSYSESFYSSNSPSSLGGTLAGGNRSLKDSHLIKEVNRLAVEKSRAEKALKEERRRVAEVENIIERYRSKVQELMALAKKHEEEATKAKQALQRKNWEMSSSSDERNRLTAAVQKLQAENQKLMDERKFQIASLQSRLSSERQARLNADSNVLRRSKRDTITGAEGPTWRKYLQSHRQLQSLASGERCEDSNVLGGSGNQNLQTASGSRLQHSTQPTDSPPKRSLSDSFPRFPPSSPGRDYLKYGARSKLTRSKTQGSESIGSLTGSLEAFEVCRRAEMWKPPPLSASAMNKSNALAESSHKNEAESSLIVPLGSSAARTCDSGRSDRMENPPLKLTETETDDNMCQASGHMRTLRIPQGSPERSFIIKAHPTVGHLLPPSLADSLADQLPSGPATGVRSALRWRTNSGVLVETGKMEIDTGCVVLLMRAEEVKQSNFLPVPDESLRKG
eukprot:GHVN01065750.1.p1 GENE.GHVN01065750.1~~GHVN01065750.1.p1  ORF type:complete len:527 (+),score=60.23 GHVN01065750.1:1551-3131(+)